MGYYDNVKKQYLIGLFQSLVPAYVIERLFWQERGMDVRMVVACEIIYACTVILFEIPSGILADRFGRKRLLVMDGAFSALELLILLYADRFWMFALAIFFAGVGRAFSSGSQNALLYDSLLSENRQGEFEKLLGRLSAIDFAGSVAAALCGGVLAHFFGFSWNYRVSVCSMVIAFLLSLTLKEPPMTTRPEGELAGLRQYTKQAVMFFKEKPLVLLYCATGAVMGACLIYIDEFWQLLLGDVGVPVLFFGFVSALVLSIRIPGDLFAYKLKERLGYRAVLRACIALHAVSYAVIIFTKNALCLIPIFLLSLSAGVIEQLVTGYLHHRAESHIRATVESFSSLGLRLITMLVGLPFGIIGARFSVFAAFAVPAVICVGYFLIFVCIEKRRLDSLVK